MAGGERADVVIIGGGAIGCSVAYHLARRGVKRVTVLERGRVGGGASTKAAGGLRAQFATEINIRFSLLSLPFFQRAADELEAPVPYDQVGYIFLARSAPQAEAFRRNVELQRRLGVDSTWLRPEAIAARWPFLRVEGVTAGTWCPTDALTDQVRFMAALGQRVRALGVDVREGVEVRALRAERGRVIGVETAGGPIEAGTTVLAAGLWSPALGRTIGLELPITPVRRDIFTTAPVTALPRDLPFIADFDIGRYLRRDADGMRFSGAKDVANDLSPVFDIDQGPAMRARIAELVPAMRDAKLTGGWAGLDEFTPDHHALFGPVPEHPGLIVAAGFSGHGLMHAPAAGLLAAELILDGRTSTLDASPLAPDRFARGQALTESMVAPIQATTTGRESGG